MSDTAPPGWYPDGSGTQRYWDGGRWLDTPPGPRSWADGGYGGGYGGPPPGPPPGRSRTGLYAVLGVVAVVLVAALVTTLVLVSGGDDTERAGDDTSRSAGAPGDGASTDEPEESEPADDRPDPADTVQAFVDATLAADCDAVEALVTEEFLDDSGGCDPSDLDTDDVGDVELEVGDSTVDGDTATVVLTSTYEGQSADVELALVYEDDAWLIDGTDLPDGPTASAPTIPSPS